MKKNVIADQKYTIKDELFSIVDTLANAFCIYKRENDICTNAVTLVAYIKTQLKKSTFKIFAKMYGQKVKYLNDAVNTVEIALKGEEILFDYFYRYRGYKYARAKMHCDFIIETLKIKEDKHDKYRQSSAIGYILRINEMDSKYDFLETKYKENQ